jgi:hypothetical protein
LLFSSLVETGPLTIRVRMKVERQWPSGLAGRVDRAVPQVEAIGASPQIDVIPIKG